MNLMFQPITYFQLLVLVVLTRMAINLNLIMDSIFFTFRYFLKNRHRLQIQFFIGRQEIESCLRVLLD